MSMAYLIYALLGLAALGGFAALVYCMQDYRYRRQLEQHGEEKAGEDPTVVNPADMECCGQHEVCEKESLLSAVSKGVEYYDDEDLDRFRGRAPEDYTDEETDEFRDVLYTMREEEVAGWARSLQLRGIELPEEVRDEVILIVEERRQEPQTKPAT